MRIFHLIPSRVLGLPRFIHASLIRASLIRASLLSSKPNQVVAILF